VHEVTQVDPKAKRLEEQLVHVNELLHVVQKLFKVKQAF